MLIVMRPLKIEQPPFPETKGNYLSSPWCLKNRTRDRCLSGNIKNNMTLRVKEQDESLTALC